MMHGETTQVRRHTRPRHASATLPPRYSGFYVFTYDASTLLRLQPATATSLPASQGSPFLPPTTHPPTSHINRRSPDPSSKYK